VASQRRRAPGSSEPLLGRGSALGSINAYCTIPYDAAHPDPGLPSPLLDWGKVTKVEQLSGTFGLEEVVEEVIEIAGQRATYRTVNDFGFLGSLDVEKGDLIALCSEGEDTVHHLPGGPLMFTHLIVPLSAPPRLAEIAPFAPRHMMAGQIPDAVGSGKLGDGRYLVYTEIGRADGEQFFVEREQWKIAMPPDAPWARRIAPGKRMWLVVGALAPDAGAADKPRPVLQVFAALDELFP
jgi:hypothetical protein